ncbi:MAG TPA: hypothetical protein VMV81_01660, partial [Phycisphaerae bacterium]|nr:hypothetical protein [Phycisphaerae bacterium]
MLSHLRLKAIIGMATLCVAASMAAALPPGFVESTAVTGLNQAVGLTFAPDGRMFIWEKAGKVWIYQDGALLLTP